jgi:hypothetical protein
MKDLFLTIIEGKQKAVVAGVVTALLVLLAQVGVDGDMTVKDALTALGSWIVTHYLVWATRNR